MGIGCSQNVMKYMNVWYTIAWVDQEHPFDHVGQITEYLWDYHTQTILVTNKSTNEDGTAHEIKGKMKPVSSNKLQLTLDAIPDVDVKLRISDACEYTLCTKLKYDYHIIWTDYDRFSIVADKHSAWLLSRYQRISRHDLSFLIHKLQGVHPELVCRLRCNPQNIYDSD